MSVTSPITAREFLELPDKICRRELVAGELRMMSPSGWRHGKVVANLSGLLVPYVRAKDLGDCFGAETGFLIARNPDTVRAPDFAFVAKENLARDKQEDAYWTGAPDFAVEVLSPSDRTVEVEEKIESWINAGVRMVWVVDPKLRVVRVYCPQADVVVCYQGDEIDGGKVLSGFHCEVNEFVPAS